MRSYITKLSLPLSLSALLLSGCASIVGDSTYPVAVNSSPAGASFEVRNNSGKVVHTGTTPQTVTLDSGDGYFSGAQYTIAFSKEGHAPQEVTVDSSLSGWYWGNILFGGLIGMLIVDPITGAMYKLPEGTSVDLGEQVVKNEHGENLTLLTIDQLPAHQRENLIRVN
ncbi:hypothetical protein HNP49_000378 [Pseudomonas fluvialis]|uniref:PEGA domain-containing protein n=1 Tax=Pseudomonas fluvialis TaxID=1793966 RepID=A0A7X0BPK7_9PSED|nr:hypothetical protein [Pseudomonas fluvialis]MBB6340228.1 hypothetical protein [Pseudomonas fluvialis]